MVRYHELTLSFSSDSPFLNFGGILTLAPKQFDALQIEFSITSLLSHDIDMTPGADMDRYTR